FLYSALLRHPGRTQTRTLSVPAAEINNGKSLQRLPCLQQYREFDETHPWHSCLEHTGCRRAAAPCPWPCLWSRPLGSPQFRLDWSLERHERSSRASVQQ